MLIIKGLTAVAALANGASAFFPWNPPVRCEGQLCPDSKREEEVQARSNFEEAHTLKIVQRIPTNDLSEEIRINRLAERLTKKYSRVATRVNAKNLEDRSGLNKRTNTYSIATASTPTQTNSAGISQDGTDYSYFAQVGLGSAKTPMYMLLDTGAGTTWVMGPSCKSDSCKLHNSFGAADSTTFKSSTKAFSVSYGSGSVSGNLATDSLDLAGLTVTMTLGIADTTSADFTDFPMDGILGLSQAQGNTPNFIETLVTSKDLKSNLFGVDLNRASDGGANNGEINFGAPNPSKYTGDIHYSTVDTGTGGDWAIPLDDMGVDGTLAGVTGRLAYIDTGTSYIFGPPADVAKFHKVVSGSQSSDDVTFSVPCTTTTAMEFVFAGVSYSVSSKDWVGNSLGNGRCTSNIFGHEVVAGAWLLGDTFLKNVYTVFDVDENRIGFAAKTGSNTVATSATSTSSTGGPTPLSDTSSSTTEFPETLSSSNPVPVTTPSPDPITKSTDTLSKTQSNEDTIVSTSLSSTTLVATATSAGTSETGASSTNTLGLGGHETSDPTGTAAAETSASAATNSAAPSSDGVRLSANLVTTAFVLAVLLMTSV